ncbi:putative MFS family arabinose efflux permease [Actinoplanes campanulatus]|uniref:Putative MFS family arabinose efflux permease n=1 Tax=Actinoplanes campanulatus TaxID=113559 RepID=A0A7W5FE47_9ACTN|nr:MFS transporter [Actinoplanes campanulatus]MBB3095021.1 putative MFS family arabinose efflux permease [Actinoplanes campanulatus]GGN22882.1 MFS transporter [Actinoplanes campanulatus]GID34625.1 MFS transporter [Actinoplanes campanulatus]
MSSAVSAPSGLRTVLRAPFVRRLLVFSQTGRLPMAAAPLALLLFAREEHGLTLAGLVVAAYTAGMAVSAPLLARIVDRWRQPPVLWGSAVLSGAGFVVVAASGHSVPVMLAGAVGAGFGTPPLEACLRALWPNLVPAENVAAAYSLDLAVQEVIYVTGPLVTLAAVGLAGPSAGLLAAAVLQLAGVAGFALTPVVRTWRGEAGARHWAGPLRVPRFVVIVAGVICAGAAVGSLPVAVTGYAEAAGNRALSGWLLAAQAAGALIGGLLYTRAAPGGPGRLPLTAAALAAGFVPLLLVPGPAPMAVLLAVSGLSLPPLLTAVFLAADRLTPPGTAVEAFAWIITAFTVGSAAGAAITGPLVSDGIRYGFAFAPIAGLLAVAAMSAATLGARVRV